MKKQLTESERNFATKSSINQMKIETIQTFKEEVLEATKKVESYRTSAYPVMEIESELDEAAWEIALQYRRFIENTISSSDGNILKTRTIGDKTQLVSSVLLGDLEVDVYTVFVNTNELEKYALASNGCIQYLDALDEPFYIS